jgi:hypothetical protein
VVFEIGVLTFDRILFFHLSYATYRSDTMSRFKKEREREGSMGGYVLVNQFGAEGMRILQHSNIGHGTFS